MFRLRRVMRLRKVRECAVKICEEGGGRYFFDKLINGYDKA